MFSCRPEYLGSDSNIFEAALLNENAFYQEQIIKGKFRTPVKLLREKIDAQHIKQKTLSPNFQPLVSHSIVFRIAALICMSRK